MPIQIDVPGHGIVEFPDGMTDQQIEAAIKANGMSIPMDSKPLPPLGQQSALIPGQGTDQPTPERPDYVEPSFSDKARGAVQAGGGAIMGMIGGIPAMGYGAARDIYERTFGDGKAGVNEGDKYAQEAMGKIPFMPKEGSLGQEYLKKAGEVASVLPPVIPELGMLANSSKLSRLKSEALANVPKNNDLNMKQTVFREGREYGYKATPSAVKETNTGTVLEAIARKQKIEAETSINNAQIRAKDIRNDLGLSEGNEISIKDLEDVRANIGTAKDNLIAEYPTMPTDDSFRSLATGLNKKYDYIKEQFPGIANRDEVDTSQAMGLVRYLRQKADEKFSSAIGKKVSPENSLEATNAISAADKIEGMIEDGLAKSGKSDLLDKYKQERIKTAQTYAIQKALNPTTGEVIGSQLAAQHKNNPELFTGALKRAAEHATAFPYNNKEVSRVHGVQAINPMQSALAVTAIATGHPFVAAGEIGLSSMPAKMLTSDWLQNKILKINPSLDKAVKDYTTNALSVKMDNPTRKAYLQAAGEEEAMTRQKMIESRDAVLQAAGKSRAAIQAAEALAKKTATELGRATESRILMEAGEIRGNNMIIDSATRAKARKTGQLAEAQANIDAGLARGENMLKVLNSAPLNTKGNKEVNSYINIGRGK